MPGLSKRPRHTTGSELAVQQLAHPPDQPGFGFLTGNSRLALPAHGPRLTPLPSSKHNDTTHLNASLFRGT
jgi:hypothetical protein